MFERFAEGEISSQVERQLNAPTVERDDSLKELQTLPRLTKNEESSTTCSHNPKLVVRAVNRTKLSISDFVVGPP